MTFEEYLDNKNIEQISFDDYINYEEEENDGKKTR